MDSTKGSFYLNVFNGNKCGVGCFRSWLQLTYLSLQEISIFYRLILWRLTCKKLLSWKTGFYFRINLARKKYYLLSLTYMCVGEDWSAAGLVYTANSKKIPILPLGLEQLQVVHVFLFTTWHFGTIVRVRSCFIS